MICRATAFCLLLTIPWSSWTHPLLKEDDFQDLNIIRILLYIISNYFKHDKCLHIIDDFGFIWNQSAVLSHIQMSFILMILTQPIKVAQMKRNVLANAVTDKCRTYLIVTNDSYNVSEYLYYFSVNYTNGNDRQYVFLEHEDREDSKINLTDNFKRISPNTIVLKAQSSNTTSKIRNKFEIFTFSIENNLKPGSLILINTWNGYAFENSGNLFPDKFANLHGIPILLAMLDYPPYCFVTNTSYEGSEIRALNEATKKYNFTLDIMVASDGFGIVFYENGSVGGLFGVVLHGEPELGISGIYNDQFNHERFTLTTTYLQSALSFLTPKPHDLSYLWYVFLPLGFTLWITILGFIVIRVLLFVGFATLQHKILNQNSTKYSTDICYVFLNSISIQLGISVSEPSYSSLQHLLNWSHIISIMIITAYGCNLVSFLTVPLFSEPIETLQQFAESGLKWGIIDLSWLDTFEGTADPTVVLIKERYLYFQEVEKLNNLAREGKIAILVERLHSGGYTNVDFLASDVVKGLYLMEEDVLRVHVSTILKRGSPFVTKLNHMFKWLRDTGIFTYWDKDVFDNFMPAELAYALSYEPEEVEGPCVLKMKHLNGAFLCLIIGLCFSMLVFVCEVLICYILIQLISNLSKYVLNSNLVSKFKS